MNAITQTLLTDLEKILAASPVMYRQAKDSCGRNEGEPVGTIMAQLPIEELAKIQDILKANGRLVAGETAREVAET